MEYLDEIINMRIKPSQKEILKKKMKKKTYPFQLIVELD